ncbi:MAG: hypothetical protein QW096_13215 [Thermofilaceae archaeon]
MGQVLKLSISLNKYSEFESSNFLKGQRRKTELDVLKDPKNVFAKTDRLLKSISKSLNIL